MANRLRRLVDERSEEASVTAAEGGGVVVESRLVTSVDHDEPSMLHSVLGIPVVIM